uniref:DNA polymerase II subunit 2 n=1 Tax=Lygus hesperus TaxID=30085 RepID=A0A0A9WAH0_LYGHE
MGHYISKRNRNLCAGDGASDIYVQVFSKFAAFVAAKYPTIASDATFGFLFLPGPQDFHIGTTFPSPPLPHTVQTVLRKSISNCWFGWNPTRIIAQNTSELVLFHSSLLDVLKPLYVDTLANRHTFTNLICDHAHLCPFLHPRINTVFHLDYMLQLPVLPHTLIYADTAFTCDSHLRFNQPHMYCGCEILYPKSFSDSQSYILYLGDMLQRYYVLSQPHAQGCVSCAGTVSQV